MASGVTELLRTWLARRASAEAVSWLDESLDRIRQGEFSRLASAFSLASRKVGKADLDLTEADLAAAESARKNWNPSRWTADHSARTLLVLTFPSHDAESYAATLDRLFAAADVAELMALYQALPLYPHPERFVLRAAEGLRSNMKAVFEAVAHRNPYPAERLDETQWNQMVLKCLFIGSSLDPIVGIDNRANASLARMLVDYAKERRAAGRPICPELWRCVGPFADEEATAWLQGLLNEGSPIEKKAAALALSSRNPSRLPAEVRAHIDDGTWTWHTIAGQSDSLSHSAYAAPRTRQSMPG